MRTYAVGFFLAAGALAASLGFSPMGNGPAGQARAAGESGWVDVFPGKDLKGWKRVPIEPDTKLNAKNPWKVDATGKILVCDGVGVKEMFLCDRQFKDGTFHVEWRFRPVKDRSDYNSGVYVRTAGDGKLWHQAQVAHVQMAPRMGDLFGITLVDGKPKKFVVEGRGTKLVHPPGEWNTYEVTCKGKKITVTINGKVATTWDNCQVPRGHIGLQSEYFFIEFRNLKFKPLD